MKRDSPCEGVTPPDRSMHQSNVKRGKKTPDAVAGFHPGDVVMVVGLAHCVFCRAPLFFNGYRHFDNPRLHFRCTVLRQDRCVGSYQQFVKNCNIPGSENW